MDEMQKNLEKVAVCDWYEKYLGTLLDVLVRDGRQDKFQAGLQDARATFREAWEMLGLKETNTKL